MTRITVRKFGRSLGILLPKEVIRRLRAKEGERLLLIEVEEGDYRLTSYEPAFGKKMKKAQAIMSRYRNTLRALAE